MDGWTMISSNFVCGGVYTTFNQRPDLRIIYSTSQSSWKQRQTQTNELQLWFSGKETHYTSILIEPTENNSTKCFSCTN